MKRMSMRIKEKLSGRPMKKFDVVELSLVEKDSDNPSSFGNKSRSAKLNPAVVKKKQLIESQLHGEGPKIEVIDYFSQWSSNNQTMNDESVAPFHGEEIQLPRSARKTIVPGSFSVKGKKLFKPKDIKVFGENKLGRTPSKMKVEPLLLFSKDEFGKNFELQQLTPTFKPKDSPMKKSGGKENNLPVLSAVNPMIYKDNFPILKLHRIDEPSSSTGEKSFSVVLPSGSRSPAADDLQDKWLVWNGDGYCNYSSEEEDDSADSKQQESIQDIIESLDSFIEENPVGKDCLRA